MKKQNALLALSVLALLPVLAGFLAACPEPYQPSVQDPTIDPPLLTLSKDHQIVNVTVSWPRPSSVSIEDVSIGLSFDTEKLKITIKNSNYNPVGDSYLYISNNHVITDSNVVISVPEDVLEITVEAKAAYASTEFSIPITFTIEPGGKTVTCAVNKVSYI